MMMRITFIYHNLDLKPMKTNVSSTDTVWNFIANKMQKAYISRETIKLKLNDYGKRELPFWEVIWV